MSRNQLPDNWEELTSRERDELVARHVLGWGQRRISSTEHLPSFSTDIAAAWQVVDAYPNLRFSLERFETRGSSTAGFRDMDHDKSSSCWAHAENPAEAICIAGLRVVGLLQ
jgi:Phage ABA sandwich domain